MAVELIDRTALLKEFEQLLANVNESSKAELKNYIMRIKHQPTVAESVERGRWEKWRFRFLGVPVEDYHKCSVCLHEAEILKDGSELLSNYCPHCGAKVGLTIWEQFGIK